MPDHQDVEMALDSSPACRLFAASPVADLYPGSPSPNRNAPPCPAKPAGSLPAGVVRSNQWSRIKTGTLFMPCQLPPQATGTKGTATLKKVTGLDQFVAAIKSHASSLIAASWPGGKKNVRFGARSCSPVGRLPDVDKFLILFNIVLAKSPIFYHYTEAIRSKTAMNENGRQTLRTRVLNQFTKSPEPPRKVIARFRVISRVFA